MDQLGHKLAIAAFVLVLVIFGAGLLQKNDLKLMFLTAVSMAVAAIPEGLPAVVTIALALGSQRMLRRHALIRKLPAVETLGSVTVVCSDKTGTLTQNRMTVTVLDAADERIDVVEHLRGTRPVAQPGDAPAAVPEDKPALAFLLAAGALCNDAALNPGAAAGTWEGVGDPTEGALLVAAARLGLLKPDLDRALPRVAEVPFDSDRKRMTTIHRVDAATAPRAVRRIVAAAGNREYVALTKGAADGLLDVSDRMWCRDHVEALDAAWRERVAGANARMADQGMRVLGVAMQSLAEPFPATGRADELERGLIFVGLVAMIDPPRPEVKQSVATCREAGIRTVMITGDHPLTAAYIARDLGILQGERVVTGAELEGLSPAALAAQVESVSVFARVSPEHKLNIVQALQEKGHVVAMTGDGVNDAPALRKADIGVAMGITGTDVSKEAGDMVLRDDNFATIVAAVEEGRVIYDNIRKFIKYLLATNSGELWVMLAAPLLGMPLPMLPLQILWMNLVTDGLPALALGVEPAERNVMRRRSYPVSESVFARGMGLYIIWIGALMALVSLGMGWWAWRAGHAHWQSMVFTTLTLAQLANVLALRSERESFFTIGPLSNKPLLAAVIVTTLLQLSILYVPFLQRTFKTQPLSWKELALSLGLASILFWAVELEKWIKRRAA